MIVETYNNIKVLRDDLLPGGTKSILMPFIINDQYNEYVYASPVYGGLQIALSEYCSKVKKRITIVCAKRKQMHENTIRCLKSGANIIEVDYGYLTVVEKRAKDYSKINGAKKIEFGGKNIENKKIISNRVQQLIKILGKEPDEIYCAVGSGTLVESILDATKHSKVCGVIVGKYYENQHQRLTLMKHHLDFNKESKFKSEFPSMKNYDLKAYEYCIKYRKSNDTLFWNVL